MKENKKITGFHGCSCHPFKSWEELEYFEKQKLDLEQLVIDRHSKRVGHLQEEIATGFYLVCFLPGNKESDMQLVHKTNLIKR